MFNRILIYLYRLCRNQRVLFGSIPHPGCKRQRCFSFGVPQNHSHSRRWRRGFVYYNCLAKMTIILILPMFHPKHNQNQNTPSFWIKNHQKTTPKCPKTPKTKNRKNTLHTHFQHPGYPPSLQMGFHCHPLRLATRTPLEGTEAIGDPKDVLLAENGTLFVSDEASHLGGFVW